MDWNRHLTALFNPCKLYPHSLSPSQLSTPGSTQAVTFVNAQSLRAPRSSVVICRCGQDYPKAVQFVTSTLLASSCGSCIWLISINNQEFVDQNWTKHDLWRWSLLFAQALAHIWVPPVMSHHVIWHRWLSVTEQDYMYWWLHLADTLIVIHKSLKNAVRRVSKIPPSMMVHHGHPNHGHHGSSETDESGREVNHVKQLKQAK